MKKYQYIFICFFMFVVSARGASDRLHLVTSTTVLNEIVSAVGRDQITTHVIVEGAMCPGHFDCSSRDIQNISEADMILYHGWERWIDDFKESFNNKISAYSLDILTNLMIPDEHIKAVEKVILLLSSHDPEHTELYRKNGEIYKQDVNRQLGFLQGIMQGKPVIAEKKQVDFLQWLGCEIVLSYNARMLSPNMMMQCIEKGKKYKVKSIVDNRQSSRKAGLQIARELEAKHSVLTNFPIDDSYIETIKKNYERIQLKTTSKMSS